jgi:glucokinase
LIRTTCWSIPHAGSAFPSATSRRRIDRTSTGTGAGPGRPEGDGIIPTARLVTDIGGTNARFALVGADGRPRDERTLKTRDYPGVVEAARTYLYGRDIESAVLVVAGPVESDQIRLTNCPWSFSLEATKAALEVEELLAINDFVAQALAVPELEPDDVVQLRGGAPLLDRAVAVIGPGTGLGVAGLLRVDGRWRPIPTEGGHVSFAPRDELEIRILQELKRRFGHVSNERLLSGPGLVNLANALAVIQGAAFSLSEPEEVVTRAAEQQCAVSIEAIHRFCSLLGAAAGDLALTLGARGGVYLTGGMISHLGSWFETETVIDAFLDKGRFRAYLDPIPVYRIRRQDIGLLGAAVAVA